jgi:hypothetical protein
MSQTQTRIAFAVLGLIAVVTVGVAVGATGRIIAADDDTSAQVGRLYELQGDFHAAATLRDPNDLEERLADMLSLWAEDGMLTLGPNTFTGRGEPGTASCEPGAGTLCDFFANVAPPFQNPWISLAPSYKTEIEVSGNSGSMNFQCLYFDQNWAPQIRLQVAATATKSGSVWLFSSAVVTPIAPPGIPFP